MSGRVTNPCERDPNRLRIGLIADELTRCALIPDAELFHLTPENATTILGKHKPDLLFVESSWTGLGGSWKGGIASYPRMPWRNNKQLKKVVQFARDLGIPAIFWNKEDGVHFDRFIRSAALFDHVFTVDSDCLPEYRKKLNGRATVDTLEFAIQPAIHRFSGFNFKHNRCCFMGSYSTHVHKGRRKKQHMMFSAASNTLGLTVFDRNSARPRSVYRFPQMPNMQVYPARTHVETANVYRDYLVSLNVNTMESSPTMFSRRLIEIMACGGMAVTTPSVAVDKLFSEYCWVIRDDEEANDLFSRLSDGPSKDDLERMRAAADHVGKNYTWANRLEKIRNVAHV